MLTRFLNLIRTLIVIFSMLSGIVYAATCTISMTNTPIDMGGLSSNDIAQIGQKGYWVSLPKITFTSCSPQSKVWLKLNTSLDQGHIALPSNMGAAIGLSADDMFLLDLNNPVEVNRYWLPGNVPNTFVLSLKAAFVRTQPTIAPGPINVAPNFTLTMDNGSIDPGQITLNFVAALCVEGCHIPAGAIPSVVLGQFSAADFPQIGSRSPKKRFAIRFAGCNPGEKLSLTFSSANATTQNLFALNKGQGMASGLAIGIVSANTDQLIEIDKKLAIGIVSANTDQLIEIDKKTPPLVSDPNGELRMEFDAFYQRIEKISAGKADGTVLVTTHPE